MQNPDCGGGSGPVAGHGGPMGPAPWIERFAAHIPENGPILDLACGGGRHTRYFLDLGHPVTAVDRDRSGLRDLKERPGLEAVEADLEAGPWPFAGRAFAAVVAVNYLYRPLFPRIAQAIRPGGVVLYETFARGNERFGRPSNPDFLLRPGELLEAFGPDFTVVAYRHGRVVAGDGFAVKQSVCALRGPAESFPLPPM